MSTGNEREPHPVSTADVIDVQLGNATDEQIARVRHALSNPDSEASAWLKKIEGWAARAFGVRRLTLPVPARDRVIENTGAVLERIFGFVDKHHRDGTLTSDEADSVFDAARTHGVFRGVHMSDSSPRLQLSAIKAMIEKLIELRPTLVEHLKGIDDARSR